MQMLLLILTEIIRWGFVLIVITMLWVLIRMVWEDTDWWIALPATIFMFAVGVLFVLVILTLPRLV